MFCPTNLPSLCVFRVRGRIVRTDWSWGRICLKTPKYLLARWSVRMQGTGLIFWVTKADGGDLPTKSSSPVPTMKYNLPFKRARWEVEELAKVAKIKKIQRQPHKLLAEYYLSHQVTLSTPRSSLLLALKIIFPDWANQLNASQATQSISSTQGLRGFQSSSLGRLPLAQHLTT